MKYNNSIGRLLSISHKLRQIIAKFSPALQTKFISTEYLVSW